MLRVLCVFCLHASVKGLLPTLLVSQHGRSVVRSACPRMATETAIAKKAPILQAAKDLMEPSALIFCAKAEGLTVNQINGLRMKFPEGSKMKCVKNTLIRLATEDHPKFQAENLDDLLCDSNYWFFVPETGMRESVKAWDDFLKDVKREDVNGIKGGIFDGQVLDAAGVQAVSKLPTKQELMGTTASLLKALPAKLARSIDSAGATRLARSVKQASGSKLVRAVKAASDKMS